MNPTHQERASACPWQDSAALHLLGSTAPEEAQRYFAHLESCSVCDAEHARMAAAVAEVDLALAGESAERGPVPASTTRQRLLSAISAEPRLDRTWRRWSAGLPEGASQSGFNAGLYAVAAADGRFEPIGIEGIAVKRLATDPARRAVTMLIRMAAGTAYPRHRHADDEECFVIAGDLRIGERVLGPGDYQKAARGSIHEVQSTERGCLLYITSSQDDELV
jgi:quercetin dioxygenase-like cupin family protein